MTDGPGPSEFVLAPNITHLCLTTTEPGGVGSQGGVEVGVGVAPWVSKEEPPHWKPQKLMCILLRVQTQPAMAWETGRQ